MLLIKRKLRELDENPCLSVCFPFFLCIDSGINSFFDGRLILLGRLKYGSNISHCNNIAGDLCQFKAAKKKKSGVC